MKVPITAAFTITVTRAIATVILTKYSALKAKWLTNITIPAIVPPLMSPKRNSFSNRLIISPSIELFAKPCTTIADDCTPTFPAVA